jgi:hypothetical protein
VTRIAWTGTRLPAAGFTDEERAIIRADVRMHVRDFDMVGVGLCDGVDEEVVFAAAELRDQHGVILRIVGFLPAPQYRNRRVSERALQLCDQVIDTGADLLGRDQSLVSWCDVLRAIPRYPVEPRGPKGLLFVKHLPRSGTGYSIRRAQEAGKLAERGITPLRLAPPDRA